MSFRIKPSHPFLKPPENEAPPQPSEPSFDFLQDKPKDDDYKWLAENQHRRAPKQHPKKAPNSKMGLVIRNNPRAQEDFM